MCYGSDLAWSCPAQGASQIRQSFSKRKRGIAQKAYQLHKITDAKVGHSSRQQPTGLQTGSSSTRDA